MQRASEMKNFLLNTCPTRRTDANYNRRTQAFSSHSGNLLLASHTRFSSRSTDARRWGHGPNRWLLRRGLPSWRLTDVLRRRRCHERNEARVEALLRTVPEESMRVQFRYEVVENANGLIDRYEALQRTESDVARRMDAIRIEGWRKEEEHSEFLTRLAAVYFIWDPALHERLNRTTTSVLASHKDDSRAQAVQPAEIEPSGGFPGSIKRLFKKTAAPVSAESQAQIGKKKHLSIVTQFESFLRGIESSLKTGGAESIAHGSG